MNHTELSSVQTSGETHHSVHSQLSHTFFLLLLYLLLNNACPYAPVFLVPFHGALTQQVWLLKKKIRLAGSSTNSQPCLTANKHYGQEAQQSEGPITQRRASYKGLKCANKPSRKAGEPLMACLLSERQQGLKRNRPARAAAQ